jgi:hypothetical protein
MLAVREQRTLATLSVFVGTFSREAAGDVAGAALPLLAALADKSLLQIQGAMRCSLHPLIRQFAGDKLDSGTRAEAMRRHALWFHGLLARGARSPKRAPTHAGRDRRRPENAPAWRWAIDTVDTDRRQRHRLKRFFVAASSKASSCCATPARPHKGVRLRGAAGVGDRAAAVPRFAPDEAAASARQGIRFAREAGQRSALIRCLACSAPATELGLNVEAKLSRPGLAHTQSVRDARAPRWCRATSRWSRRRWATMPRRR